MNKEKQKETSLAEQIAKISEAIDILRDQLELLRETERSNLAQQFIAEHEITLGQVERSAVGGLPWFHSPELFASWLATNSEKAWVEWNGKVISRSEFFQGYYAQANFLLSDLPGAPDHS